MISFERECLCEQAPFDWPLCARWACYEERADRVRNPAALFRELGCTPAERRDVPFDVDDPAELRDMLARLVERGHIQKTADGYWPTARA